MVFFSVLILQLYVEMRIVCVGLFYHLLEYALVNAYILNGTKVIQKLAHVPHLPCFPDWKKIKKKYSIIMGGLVSRKLLNLKDTFHFKGTKV